MLCEAIYTCIKVELLCPVFSYWEILKSSSLIFGLCECRLFHPFQAHFHISFLEKIIFVVWFLVLLIRLSLLSSEVLPSFSFSLSPMLYRRNYEYLCKMPICFLFFFFNLHIVSLSIFFIFQKNENSSFVFVCRWFCLLVIVCYGWFKGLVLFVVLETDNRFDREKVVLSKSGSPMLGLQNSLPGDCYAIEGQFRAWKMHMY